MEDKTQKSERDNSVFSAAPDPLLDLRADVDVNIYEPGSLFSRHSPQGMSACAKESFSKVHPDFMSAWRAHPSQFGRKQVQPPSPNVAPTPSSYSSFTTPQRPLRFDAEKKTRGTAVVLGLLFGFQGAHNFYWGHVNRGILDVLLWVACLFAFFYSGILLMMLPVAIYVGVELIQICMARGIYRELPMPQY
ncbi:TM2 domain-containing membrane protein YozV [Arcanobacterium pluranimalium]|uniref:TM2 domain-containing protein n=1 Tax=Arcanobacterium pluranimalium TaxID=108028 RepID=UPI00195DE3DD|nr:TM2 domain-containing protein [Arcanobacterium pluranimalium]MBM7824251.1 TM2 domain-containing membrane protein YozV [Arcanobacterium pluranimalium]